MQKTVATHEHFPFKARQPGAPPTKPHTLSAGHINDLSEAVARLARGAPITDPIKEIVTVQIISLLADPNDTIDSGLYRISRRYHDGQDNPDISFYGQWFTESTTNNGSYVLDTRGHGGGYNVGDILTAYWDAQRGAYVPCAPSRPMHTPLVEVVATDGEELIKLDSADTLSGFSVIYQIEISYDGGSTWLIASDQMRLLLDLTDVDTKAPSSGSGFVSILASNNTRVRLSAFRGDHAWGKIYLAYGTMRLRAKSRGGTYRYPTTEAKEVWHKLQPLTPSIEVANDVNNPTLYDLPVFSLYQEEQEPVTTVVINTPHVEKGNPNSDYEWWTIEIDFQITCSIEYEPCPPHIDYQSAAPAPNIVGGGGQQETGNHITFQLELNDQTLHNRRYHIPIIEGARGSGTGFASFKAVDGDIVKLTAYNASQSGIDATIVQGMLRLEAKCAEAIANTYGPGGSFSPVTNFAKVAEVNNDDTGVLSGWPKFTLGSSSGSSPNDKVTINLPEDSDSWTIEAEFSLSINSPAEQSSQSLSSSSSISTSSSSTTVGTPPAPTPCCSNSIGTEITATFTNVASFGNITGQSMVLTYDPADSKWKGTKTLCGGDEWTLAFYCNGGATPNDLRLDWAITQGVCQTAAPSQIGLTPSSAVCSPLSVSFPVAFSSNNQCACWTGPGAGAQVTVTITS